MAFYSTQCIIPHNRFISIVDKRLVVVEEPHDNLQQNIRYIDKNGQDSIVSCYDLGNLLNFDYTQRLIFLHESDLRQCVYQAIVIPGHSIEWWTDMKCKLLQNQTSSDIYLKYIGVKQGVDVGHGVFTSTTVARGTFIGEYVGLVSTVSETIVQKDHYNFQYPTCDGGVEINGREYGNIMRFINHSIQPNSEFRALHVDDMMHVICVSSFHYFVHIFENS